MKISQSIYVPQLMTPALQNTPVTSVHKEQTTSGVKEAIKLTISEEARTLYKNSLLQKTNEDDYDDEDLLHNNKEEEKQAQRAADSDRIYEKSADGVRELSEQEKIQVRRLEQRDQEVRMHEQAHIAASGGISVSAASFTYQTGPDGKRYAIGGEVNFRTPATSDPQQALQVAQQMQKMALAPANPSSTDRAVAAKAAQDVARARMEIQQETMEEYRAELNKD